MDMTEDGSQLTIGEAASRLNVDAQTVTDWLASRLLQATATGGGHRSIDGESVEALATALELPEGPERTSALATLREHNSVSAPNNRFM